MRTFARSRRAGQRVSTNCLSRSGYRAHVKHKKLADINQYLNLVLLCQFAIFLCMFVIFYSIPKWLNVITCFFALFV